LAILFTALKKEETAHLGGDNGDIDLLLDFIAIAIPGQMEDA